MATPGRRGPTGMPEGRGLNAVKLLADELEVAR